MENFKPFKGRHVPEGKIVDAKYREDGFITLREAGSKYLLGICSSITLKDATFYKGRGFYIRGAVTSYELQSPTLVNYDNLRQAVAASEILHQDKTDANYVKMGFQCQITVE